MESLRAALQASRPVCLMSRISWVPSSCSEMTMERRASLADAPAFLHSSRQASPVAMQAVAGERELRHA